MSSRSVVLAAALAALSTFAVNAQNRPAPPATPRIYIFDNGAIKGLDPQLFNFKREELKEVDFIDVSYLIVHPRGLLMFDSGEIADAKLKNGPVSEPPMSADKPLLPQ